MFTVLDKDNSIWFVVGDNPLCIMFYDGYLFSTLLRGNPLQDHQEVKAGPHPSDILETKEGEILKIDRAGHITTGNFYAENQL